MRISSWFGFGRSGRRGGKRSLLRNQREDPRHRRRQQAAEADIAAVLEKERSFDPKSPDSGFP
jgi:hypothetical protein